MTATLTLNDGHTIALYLDHFGGLVGDCGICHGTTDSLELREHNGACCACDAAENDVFCRKHEAA